MTTDEPEPHYDPRTGKPIVNGDGSIWVPKFPGQRPPFQPGNEFRLERPRLNSGWRSPSLVDKAAAPIVAELKSMPELEYLSTPAFAAELAAYARAQARANLYAAWMDAMTLDETLTPRITHAPLETLHDLERAAANWAAKIGLTPVVPPDVAERISKARASIARKAMRRQLQDDLKRSLRHQMYPDQYPDAQ